MFDDSEDEFEDDYTESLQLIKNLEMKIQQKQEADAVQDVKKDLISAEEVHLDTPSSKAFKSSNDREMVASNSAIQTRSSKRLKIVSESKINDADVVFDAASDTIEVLMENLEDDQEAEFVIANAIDTASEDPFQSTDSNDELTTIMIDDNVFEQEPFVLQNVTKTEELYLSDESLGDKSLVEDEDTGNFDKFMHSFNANIVVNWFSLSFL